MLLKEVKSGSCGVSGMLGVRMPFFLFLIVKNPFTDVTQAPLNSTRILLCTFVLSQLLHRPSQKVRPTDRHLDLSP